MPTSLMASSILGSAPSGGPLGGAGALSKLTVGRAHAREEVLMVQRVWAALVGFETVEGVLQAARLPTPRSLGAHGRRDGRGGVGVGARVVTLAGKGTATAAAAAAAGVAAAAAAAAALAATSPGRNGAGGRSAYVDWELTHRDWEGTRRAVTQSLRGSAPGRACRRAA